MRIDRARPRRRGARGDRGAAAVEFALLMPLLLLIALGIIEFGRAYNIQLGLTAGAREGVRVMAVNGSSTDARAATLAAGPQVSPGISSSQVRVCTTSSAPGAVAVCTSPTCSAGGTATVTVTYQLVFLTSLLGDGPKLTGKGVMRCNG